jgi:glutamate--cysteine ligase
MLHYFDTEKPASKWSQEIMAKLLPIAQMIDTQNSSKDYQNALKIEQNKLDNPALTPSAKVIELLHRDNLSFYQFALQQSLANREHFIHQQLSTNTAANFTQMAAESLVKQKDIESDTSMSFEKFLGNYYKQYNCCIDE